MKTRSGFTLLETLIAVVLIGVVYVMLAPMIRDLIGLERTNDRMVAMTKGTAGLLVMVKEITTARGSATPVVTVSESVPGSGIADGGQLNFTIYSSADISDTTAFTAVTYRYNAVTGHIERVQGASINTIVWDVNPPSAARPLFAAPGGNVVDIDFTTRGTMTGPLADRTKRFSTRVLVRNT